VLARTTQANHFKPKRNAHMYMNRITLIGFTGQDAKPAATQTGKEVTRFSLATTKRYQQDSEWREKTYWHDCVVYGGYAPFAAKLNKGTHIVIEGELTYREYNRTIETETGAVNVSWPVTEIVVDSITILNRKRRENNQSEGAA
jgi:single-strand DNA-binding protein